MPTCMVHMTAGNARRGASPKGTRPMAISPKRPQAPRKVQKGSGTWRRRRDRKPRKRKWRPLSVVARSFVFRFVPDAQSAPDAQSFVRPAMR